MTDSNAVYQGFWTNHHRNFPWKWYLTLKDSWTFLLFLAIGGLALYSGSRLWAVLKYLSFKQGIHLSARYIVSKGTPNGDIELEAHIAGQEPDDPIPTHPNGNFVIDLQTSDFSQLNALHALWLRRRRSSKPAISDKPLVQLLVNECDPGVLLRLGLLAGTVLVLTIIAVPLIPWLLTGFGQETPLVKSAYTKGCGWNVDLFFPTFFAREAERQYLDCQKSTPRNASNCRTSIFELALPQIYEGNTSCPFKPDICATEAMPVSLQHYIRPVDLGYNSPSKLALHHDLSCAPLVLDNFIFPLNTNSTDFLAFLDPFQDLNTFDWTSFYSDLATSNGPNSISSNFSGWDAQRIPDPKYSSKMNYVPIPRDGRNHSLQDHFHPSLRSQNASTFVVLFEAGQNTFIGLQPIEDPIFRSTRPYGDSRVEYLPDYEVTALGCSEKYRFCFGDALGDFDHCSHWIGAYPEHFSSPINDSAVSINIENDQLWKEFDDKFDLFTLYRMVLQKTSTLQFFHLNSKFIDANSRNNGHRVSFLSPRDQWKDEARALFETAFLFARLTLFEVTSRGTRSSKTPLLNSEKDFCKSVLFLDGDYTNINGFGLIVSIASIMAPIFVHWALKMQRRCQCQVEPGRHGQAQDAQGRRSALPMVLRNIWEHVKVRAFLRFNLVALLDTASKLFSRRRFWSSAPGSTPV